ncbi:MAG: gamma carbonic anhydrase family protein [Deferribacteres bacterium]|nr:gamma carbonic anhydrase family protein [Deferribacteres bacterium]
MKHQGTILSYKGLTPRIEEEVFIAPSAYVIGDVVIGEKSSVWFGTIIRGDVNYIRIGKKTNIQDITMVHVTTAKYPTEIGDCVTIGHRALIHGCTIGSYCLIGMGAIIMDGAKIADNSIVAAGALIPPGKSFPEGVLIKGYPAKVARELTEEELEEIKRLAEHYYNISRNYTG